MSLVSNANEDFEKETRRNLFELQELAIQTQHDLQDMQTTQKAMQKQITDLTERLKNK